MKYKIKVFLLYRHYLLWRWLMRTAYKIMMYPTRKAELAWVRAMQSKPKAAAPSRKDWPAFYPNKQ